jgi:hypothetical protein
MVQGVEHLLAFLACHAAAAAGVAVGRYCLRCPEQSLAPRAVHCQEMRLHREKIDEGHTGWRCWILAQRQERRRGNKRQREMEQGSEHCCRGS